MEEYEYKMRKFQIEITRITSSSYDWIFFDENMKCQKNPGEWAPSEQIALDEAQFKIRQFVNSGNG